jgi:hypothetical protein
MDATLRRLAPLTGIGFVVLFVIGTIVSMSDSPDFADTEAAMAEFYLDNDSSILAGTLIIGVSVPFYIWFLGNLRSAIARAEGGSTRLASTAFGSGVASLALLVAGALITAMGALRVDEQGEISPAAAAVYYDIGQVIGFTGVALAFAGLLAATAIASLRYKAILPAWLAYLSIVLAIIDLILPINWIGTMVGLLWILVVSVLLYVQRVGEEGAPAPAAAAPITSPPPPPPPPAPGSAP